MRKILATTALALVCMHVLAPQASAVITNTRTSNTAALGAALTAGSSGLNSVTFTRFGRTDMFGANSTGTYTSGAGDMTLGTSGIVLSSGDVGDYSSGPNTLTNFSTAYSGATVGPNISWENSMRALDGGFTSFDDTYFEIAFTTDAGTNAISFDFVFASEEFPEFVGTSFTDVFGAFLVLDGGVEPTLSAADNVSFDNNNLSIQINSNFLPRTLNTGTEADEALPFLTTTAAVLPSTSYRLIFGINDEDDRIYDSTVWIANLTGLGGGDPGTVEIPAPGALLLGAMGMGMVGWVRKRCS